MKKNEIAFELSLITTLFLLLIVFFSIGLKTFEFHVDENYWIRATKYFKLFFLDRDFFSKEWQEWPANDHPQLARYILGLPLYLKNYPWEKIKCIPSWDCNISPEENIKNGAFPPNGALLPCRFIIVIFGALACIAMYVLARFFFNAPFSLLSAAMLAFNPVFLAYSKRAMATIPFSFFLLLNVLLGCAFFRNLEKKGKPSLGWILAAGTNAGLAASITINGFMALGIFIFLCMTAMVVRFPKKGLAATVVLVATLSFLLFWMLNPYLYINISQGLRHLIAHRYLVVTQQQHDFPGALRDIGTRAYSLLKRSLFPGNFVTLGSIVDNKTLPLDLFLFGLGMISLSFRTMRHLKEGRISSEFIVLSWLFLTYASLIFSVHMDWDRYYLPFIIPAFFVTFYGLGVLGRAIRKGLWSSTPKFQGDIFLFRPRGGILRKGCVAGKSPERI